MATNYPSAIQTFTDPSGTSPLTSPDHAALHTSINDTVEALQTTAGTTAGTNIFKNFNAGDFPARINASNVLQQVITGTVNLGAGTITGQIVNQGTVGGGAYGTAQFTGGTSTSQVINTGTINNAIIGTPAITGGTANGIVLGTPTIGSVVVPGTVSPLGFSAAIAPGLGTIVDAPAGSATVNAQSAQIFYTAWGTTAGNRSYITPLNPSPATLLTFAIKQNSNNTGTAIWGTNFRFGSAGTPTLGTNSTWNIIGFRYNLIDSKYDHLGNSLGLI